MSVAARPRIYCCNHPTTLDPWFALRRLPENTVCLVTAPAFDMPVVGTWLRKGKHIPVGPDTKSFDQAHQALRAGQNVLIFPEGNLTRKDQKWHTGALRLSIETLAPIVPMRLVYYCRILHLPVRTGDDWETMRIPLGSPEIRLED